MLMTSFRFPCLLMALLVLSACDSQESTTTAPREPAKPAISVISVAPADVVPVPVPDPEPVPTPKPPVKPPSEPARPIPKPAAKEPAVTPALKENLDLSLPADLFDELQPFATPDEFSSPALLPPLFRAQESSQSPFQLHGKLITNEQEDDYWDSLEGAELQFEFKR
ncbi:MAG: hypothetical protein Q7J43_15245 [Pseudomonas sp.]|uniref:hypothetical protein n=1 Tax=Pseudomonas sp. TaxID=306 RepID=UPI0027164872|nr:hypothetical protein [Pseudomonas sp.]MDO9619019.1 hypothetical protein [Pseudomonas sp.]